MPDCSLVVTTFLQQKLQLLLQRMATRVTSHRGPSLMRERGQFNHAANHARPVAACGSNRSLQSIERHAHHEVIRTKSVKAELVSETYPPSGKLRAAAAAAARGKALCVP